MNDQKKIISKHKIKLDNIKKHNKLYFINDKPEISDSRIRQIKKRNIN